MLPVRKCKHPSWRVRVYRDYGADNGPERFYYVACGCGLVLIDGKWQDPTNHLLESRQKA